MNFTFVILWAVLAVSQVIYLAVPLFAEVGTATLSEVFPMVLGVVAFVQGVIVVVILRAQAFSPIQSRRIDPTTTEGLAKLFTPLLLAWVIAESVAIYGLVLRLLNFDFQYWIPFSVAGAFLLFLGRPFHSKLKKPASSADLARMGGPID